MHRRNLLLLCLVVPTCLLAWAARDRSEHGRRFAEVIRQIESRYLEPVGKDELFAAALAGIFTTLDDGSRYLDAAAYREVSATRDPGLAGIGVEIAEAESADAIVIVAPVVDGPAWQAGLTAGDQILAIDNAPVAGLGLPEVAAKLRGGPGTSLTLEILPSGNRPDVAGEKPLPATRSLSLTRQLLTLAGIRGDRREADGRWDWWLEGEPQIALIRIVQFSDRTADEVGRVIEALAAERPPAGLVLDLRSTAGGPVEAAVALCDLFLEEGPIVTVGNRRQPDAQQISTAVPGDLIAGAPLVVLIDDLTAGAAEVVAACLQDRNRATVAGSRSYGEGLLQVVLPLAGEETAIQLSTAEYRRPSGDPIDRPATASSDRPWGVSPDAGFAITLTREQFDRWRRWRQTRDRPAGLPPADRNADPAATLPRLADPVLGRGLQAFSVSESAAG